MTRHERDRFDELLGREVDRLPRSIRMLLDESPIIVEDYPAREILQELGIEDRAELCGLHTGIPLTERSVTDHPDLEYIHLFREGIVELAGGWDQPEAETAIAEEIRITLLHEIGHHFGLDEDDLDDLGYG